MPKVEFRAGGDSYELEVDYIYHGGASWQGDCAFCRGDACAEYSHPQSPIAVYLKKYPHEGVCPFCQGRPS